jgi:hypothetical protein
MERKKYSPVTDVPMENSPMFKQGLKQRWTDLNDSDLDAIANASQDKFDMLVKKIAERYDEPLNIAQEEALEWWNGPLTSWVRSGRTDNPICM